MLLADIIDAQEALRLGLVNWVVPAEQLQDETQKLAERLGPGSNPGLWTGENGTLSEPHHAP